MGQTTSNQAANILSLDGGGIRGIISATVLAEIERRTGRSISSLFQLVSGTSTGGIIALALAQPSEDGSGPAHSAAEVVQFYLEYGANIFSRPLGQRFGSGFGILAARYNARGLEKVLDKFFGKTRLKDSLSTLFIPSYELERRQPFFFRSAQARIDAAYDYPMATVARSTSAAPTYFPPAQVFVNGGKDYYALADGGVFANNPAACAFVEARTLHYAEPDINLVSLGTGAFNKPFLYKDAKDWGLAQWARPILDIVFDGVSSTVDYQMRCLLPNDANGRSRYFRLQPVLDPALQAMDNVKSDNLRELQVWAQNYVASMGPEIDRICAAVTR